MPLAISVAPAKPLCDETVTKASMRPDDGAEQTDHR